MGGPSPSGGVDAASNGVVLVIGDRGQAQISWMRSVNITSDTRHAERYTEIPALTRITWPMSYRICSGEAARTVQSLFIDHKRPPVSTRRTEDIPGVARLTPVELGHDWWTEAKRTRVLANEMEHVSTGAAPMF